MRTVKFVGIALGGLVALVAIVLVGVWLFVNPNDYKDRIAAAVKESTGRELALPGKIKLSVFPWIALELGPASLGNPPGFGDEPFASVQHAALRVKLLPLLHKELKIGRVEIDGLDLRLAKNAAGKGNWQGFGGEAAAGKPGAASAGAEPLPDLAGMLIKDGRVSYGNMLADHVNLDVGHVGAGIAVPVKLKLDLTTAKGAPPIALGANFDLTPDMAKKEFRFATLSLTGTIHAKPGAPAAPWSLSAPDSSVDLAAQTLSAPHFVFKLADARVTGNASGTGILDAPSLTGAFKLDSVAPREFLDHLGIAAPRTRDAKTLDKFAASADFAYGGNAVRLSKLAAQLDESNLTGNAAITDLATHAMQFNLTLDRINIDRYMSPAPTSAGASVAKPSVLPSDLLKALRLNGRLAIGSTTVAGINLSQVRVAVVSKDGVTHIAPATARLYGGAYSGDITLDGRGAVPSMKLDQSMSDIDIAQLAQDFAKTRRISGRGNLTMDLTARGRDSDALLRTLGGHAALNLANGAILGIDLWSEINRAMAVIQKQALPASSGTGRTTFDTFKASADITNGIATTKDLNIASQNLHVTGGGTANLVTHAIDYKLMATLLKEPAAAAATNVRTLADIPVTVTGTLTDPKVRPDAEGIAKARLRKEVDKRKDELKKKLEDKLKSLFQH